MLDASLLPPPPARLVVAVSGGADSCALWDLLLADGRWPLLIWHLDHGLRPEAAADAAFVRKRAEHYCAQGKSADIIVESADVAALARAWGCGLEEAGRRHRYERLAAVALAHGGQAVCTAHHADDQAETVLAHLLRGAGPVGLAGIPPQRELVPGVLLVRPLLGAGRAHLRQHLEQRDLSWREDGSNADVRWQRNRLRQRVLPDLERACPGIGAALAAAAADARKQVDRGAALVAAAWHEDAEGLDLRPLLALDRPVRLLAWRRLLVRLGLPLSRPHLERLEAVASGPPDRRLGLRGWELWRRQGRLRWRPAPLARKAPRTQSAAIMSTTAVILAAGKGTRMNSDLAKVLHPLAGRPLVAHVLDACRVAGIDQTVVVVGWQREQVEAAVARWRPTCVVQDRQLGTGHAVLVSESAVKGDDVVVLCGDSPLIPGHLLRELMRTHKESGAACTAVAARMKDPTGYGRMVVDAAGNLVRIVEQRDASPDEQRIDLINSGLYAFRRADLFRCLHQVRPTNAQGEYYLTDVVRMLVEERAKVGMKVCESPSLILGINTPADLQLAARIYAEKSETLAMDPADSP